MAQIEVEYTYSSNYRAIVEIPDTDIDDVLAEWKQDNPEGWEPTEDDVNEAIAVLMEDAGLELDPACDEEYGWGETDIEDWHVTEPYVLPTYAEKNPEVPGQLILGAAVLDDGALDQIHMGEGLL